jgi:hypothetical protein
MIGGIEVASRLLRVMDTAVTRIRIAESSVRESRLMKEYQYHRGTHVTELSNLHHALEAGRCSRNTRNVLIPMDFAVPVINEVVGACSILRIHELDAAN